MSDQHVHPALVIGKTALITCDAWFYAPNGRTYRAVWGTVRAVHDSHNVLGVKTNLKSSNWYVEIGCMLVAGCQIHYVVGCQKCHFGDAQSWSADAENGPNLYTLPGSIFNADEVRSEGAA